MLQNDTYITSFCEKKKTTQEREWKNLAKPGMGYQPSRVYKEKTITHCGGEQPLQAKRHHNEETTISQKQINPDQSK